MTRLQNLVALSTALQTCHADAAKAGETDHAEMLHDMGVDTANLIAWLVRSQSTLIRNSRETQGEGVGK